MKRVSRREKCENLLILNQDGAITDTLANRNIEYLNTKMKKR